MKISEMIERLEKAKEKHGDVEVMFDDSESGYGPWAAQTGYVEVAEEDQYPEEFDMPEGFTFFLIGN